MGKGVLYKANATTWSKSQSKKANATTLTDGKVKHANATTWYDNYPMEQLYEQYFNVVWTHGFTGAGVRLDNGVWGDHPRSGDSVNFIGLFGFDRAAMQNFIGGGVIQDIQIEVMFDHPSHNGHPIVDFFPHTYTGKPTSFNSANVNKSHRTQSQFNQTGADYKRWIKLPVGAWLNGQMAGVAIQAPSAIAANSARFAGKTTSHGMNAFNTRMFLKVLK